MRMETGHTYEEFGKKGIWGLSLSHASEYVSLIGNDPLGHLKGFFYNRTTMSRLSNPHLILKHMMSQRILLWIGLRCCSANNTGRYGNARSISPWSNVRERKVAEFSPCILLLRRHRFVRREFPIKLGFPSLYGTVFSMPI